VGLCQSVIEHGAFFKFQPIHGRLAEHELRSLAALRAERIDVENDFCGLADRQLHVVFFLHFLHAARSSDAHTVAIAGRLIQASVFV
jgi:hypothetical protein